jgi:hypothetical protein
MSKKQKAKKNRKTTRKELPGVVLEKAVARVQQMTDKNSACAVQAVPGRTPTL